MLKPAILKGIKTWIFDLDNTLYPPDAGLYPQLTVRVLSWMRDHLHLSDEQIRALQERYLDQHGATLAGLVREYDVDAADFLDFVHRIDYSGVVPNPALASAIATLSGQRLIHTNGSATHARNVLVRLGVSENLFAGIFDLADAGYVAKPERPAFDALVSRFGLEPSSCCFIEDSLRNLETAHAMGMTTLLVRTVGEAGKPVPPFCDDVTEDLAAWLADASRQQAA